MQPQITKNLLKVASHRLGPLARRTVQFAWLSCLLALSPIQAQEKFDPDRLFQEARQLAFDKERGKAREMLEKILATYPNYHEVRIFLGSVLAWDGDYAGARTQLEQVIAAKPTMVQAYLTLGQIEIWDKQPQSALQVANRGSQEVPNNLDLWLLEARALYRLHRRDDAIYLARQIKKRDPAHEGATFLKDLLSEARLNQVGLHYQRDTFDKTFDPWSSYSLDYSRRFGFGSLILRANQADRFDKSGTQFEVDAYPKLGRGIYFYLNAGHSDDGLFPKRRFGLELFKSLPHSFEASVGLRRLEFTSSNVTLYVGSVGYYFGDYWLSFRGNYTPKELGSSKSGQVNLRRYLGTADSYLTFSLGSGLSSEESNFENFQLESDKYGLEWQQMWGTWIATAGINVSNEEVSPVLERRQTSMKLGIKRIF